MKVCKYLISIVTILSFYAYAQPRVTAILYNKLKFFFLKRSPWKQEKLSAWLALRSWDQSLRS